MAASVVLLKVVGKAEVVFHDQQKGSSFIIMEVNNLGLWKIR